MTNRTGYYKRLPPGCLLFLLLACSSRPPALPDFATPQNLQLIDNAKKQIHSGDVIFRNGRDEVSRAARSMNRKDTSYSHCGLVFVENDSIVVYHALGGSYNPSQRLRRDPIDSFCDPKENDAFGVYRYHLDGPELEKLQSVVHGYYAAGLPFDVFFNFFSDDKMYCSEFVFKSLNQSMAGALTKYIRRDTIPFGVTTDDLFLNPECKQVTREKFRF